MDTPSRPSTPSLPGTLTDSKPLRFLLRPISTVVLPSPSCVMLVLMFLVSYLSAKFSPLARAPVPAIVTLEPSLFVLGSLLFASNTRPLSIRASDVFLRSDTLTAPFGVFLFASSNCFKNVSVEFGFWIEEPTLFNFIGVVVESPPLFMDAITSPG